MKLDSQTLLNFRQNQTVPNLEHKNQNYHNEQFIDQLEQKQLKPGTYYLTYRPNVLFDPNSSYSTSVSAMNIVKPVTIRNNHVTLNPLVAPVDNKYNVDESPNNAHPYLTNELGIKRRLPPQTLYQCRAHGLTMNEAFALMDSMYIYPSLDSLISINTPYFHIKQIDEDHELHCLDIDLLPAINPNHLTDNRGLDLSVAVGVIPHRYDDQLLNDVFNLDFIAMKQYSLYYGHLLSHIMRYPIDDEHDYVIMLIPKHIDHDTQNNDLAANHHNQVPIKTWTTKYQYQPKDPNGYEDLGKYSSQHGATFVDIIPTSIIEDAINQHQTIDTLYDYDPDGLMMIPLHNYEHPEYNLELLMSIYDYQNDQMLLTEYQDKLLNLK